MATNPDTITSSEEDEDMDVDEDVTARTAAAIAEQVPPVELTAELSHAVFSNHVVSSYFEI